MKQLKITSEGIGVKLCHECENNIRCEECYYNQQSIAYWQKEAVKEFSEKLFKLCYEHKDNYKIDLVALEHLMGMAMGEMPK